MYCLHAAMILPVYELTQTVITQWAVLFHANLVLTVVSFIDLTNWDLFQSLDEKKNKQFHDCCK